MPSRLTRQALVFKALCVLDEAIERARSGAVVPNPGLRLALAFLYVVGDRRGEWFDREPYDDFWRLATQQQASFVEGHNSDAHGRLTQMNADMNAIGRAAGMPIDVVVLSAMQKARRTVPHEAPARE